MNVKYCEDQGCDFLDVATCMVDGGSKNCVKKSESVKPVVLEEDKKKK